jgi:hypothetical protein
LIDEVEHLQPASLDLFLQRTHGGV